MDRIRGFEESEGEEMKTSEFKKKISEEGYRTSDNERTISVFTKNGADVAVIDCYLPEYFYMNTSNIQIAKLVIEYAGTPIEEREEEKKYRVVLPDPKNGYDVKYMLTKQNGEVTILRAHRCHLTPLTEAEIKRNHEYLWQFAKEVENENSK